MKMSGNPLAGVFQDTREFYETDEMLKKAVEENCRNTVFYSPEHYPPVPAAQLSGHVSVTKERTFECAFRLRRKYPDRQIAVLNFASAISPGGGVLSGAAAQEESLCRCSTLYPALTQDRLDAYYYRVNRKARDPLYSDACIWTGDVVVCKSDEDIPKRLPHEEMIRTDVLTCAAPNLRYRDIPDKMLYELHLQRGRHILSIAAHHEDTVLVLGAFGCGAFCNDPEVTAKAYKQLIDEMGHLFEEIVFAVYCRDFESANYTAFRNAIQN
ncbi:MAG: TIGR02452 family protein [Solobacterium sp.]|nr:TIGR02452 family protein [Solobacterium sp.]